MDDGEFQRQMIDRTARMETKMDELFRRQDLLFEKIDKVTDNCKACDRDYDDLRNQVLVLKSQIESQWKIAGIVAAVCAFVGTLIGLIAAIAALLSGVLH